MRAQGFVRSSSSMTPLVRSGMVEWRTDAFVLPRGGSVSCMPWAWCAALGKTAAWLGLTKDHRVQGGGSMDQKQMNNVCMSEAVKARPAGAVRELPTDLREMEPFTQEEGVYIIHGGLRRLVDGKWKVFLLCTLYDVLHTTYRHFDYFS